MKLKRNDLILLGIILFLAVITFFIYQFYPRETGAFVKIQIDGQTKKVLSLEKDTVYVIKTKEYTNTLQIKDGSASITEANCPDKLCVHQHKISKKGENLICLPHKLVISIDSGSATDRDTTDELDGVVK